MREIVVNVDDDKNKIITLLENGKVVEKYEENMNQVRLEGNIYIGKVQNVLYGMQAAFIDIGERKNTFIHIRDVIPKISEVTGNKNELLSKHEISNYIKQGMPILVQVKRDSTSKKGARVSTHISLSGRFVVIMPNTNFVTISQKIEEEEEKERLIHIVKSNLPKGYGAIIRTSAYKKSEEFIKKDIQKLIKNLENINKEFEELKKENKNFKPKSLYRNKGIINRLILDVVDQNIEKIWTNDEKEYEDIQNEIKELEYEGKIKLELKKEELLNTYDLKEQIKDIDKRKIWLKCGGFITIDKTEALTAIDVNSGKYIGSKDLEQTVFKVNKEASIEIAKQVRLRDIGGIIIIDYIDMEKEENKIKITKILEEELKKDRSKTQVIGFTPLNLLEMTRKHMWGND